MESATPKTYCNPLPLPRRLGSRGSGTGAADPEVVAHEGKFYLFVTGGQVYVSEDLFTWTFEKVDTPFPVVGPALAFKDGFFYLAGNGCEGLLRSKHPLGPWENTGEIQDENGARVHWADLMFFVDDDGIFYCYHQAGTGVGTDGLFVSVMDPKSGYRRALGPQKKCFGFESSHLWERYGDQNEDPDLGWIESPFMTKHEGRYHLQYSGCGTEWTRYAVGVYSSTSPLGPFVYDERSPLLISTSGLLQGSGHHALVKGPKDRLWNFYHVLFHVSSKFDRRLCLDPVDFDADGRIVFSGPSQNPRFLDGSDAGLSLLSMNKEVKASSQAPGRDPAYAVDNYVRSFWQAADLNLPQTLEIDLGRIYRLEAQRLVFAEKTSRDGPKINWKPYGYRLEVSSDTKTWKTALDSTSGGPDSDIRYDSFVPMKGRHVRLSVTDKPEGLPLGLLDWSLFGKP